MASTESYTQVMLTSNTLGRWVCWVETRYAVVGKRVQDEQGKVWEVTERYVTWSKEILDGQRREVTRLQEVLGR